MWSPAPAAGAASERSPNTNATSEATRRRVTINGVYARLHRTPRGCSCHRVASVPSSDGAEESGVDPEQVRSNELRPGLHAVPGHGHLVGKDKAAAELVVLAHDDGAAIGLDGEDDPEMDRSDRVAVVIQQADELEGRLEIGVELF